MPTLRAIFSKYVAPFKEEAAFVQAEVSAAFNDISSRLGVSLKIAPTFYHCYPYLFTDAFPGITSRQLRTIAVAGVLYLEHICLLDSMVDDWKRDSIHMPVFASMLHERSHTILRQAFPSDSVFWSELEELNILHGRAVLEERLCHFLKIKPFDAGDFYALAAGKACVSKATHYAMAHLTQNFAPVLPLSQSQDSFNAAFQAYDDLKDWRDDLRRGQYTDTLTRALQGLHYEQEPPTVTSDLMNDISRSLYYGGIAEQVLDEAILYCRQADEAAQGIAVESWAGLVRTLSQQIVQLRNDIRVSRLETILRSQGKLKKDPETLRAEAISFLCRERLGDFKEAEHVMDFPHGQNETFRRQIGSVLQRAIISDVLLDAEDKGKILYRSDPAGYVADRTFIEAQKLTDVRGGWSYFPFLASLPPDADDLAQILQTFIRVGEIDLAPLLEEVDLLFRYGSHPNGSFETWIIDPDACDPATSTMISAIEQSWGHGADVEVVANLGYALHLGKFPQFEQRVTKAAAYVAGQQQPSGHWHPTWYATPWYGTYVCARFLSTTPAAYPQMELVVRLLEESQRPDGGYGETQSTPLETALALLTMQHVALGYNEQLKMQKAALRYLELTVRGDGSWDASNFIQMDTSRAKRNLHNYQPNWLFYKSRTISTAYVLKALLTVSDDAYIAS